MRRVQAGLNRADPVVDHVGHQVGVINDDLLGHVFAQEGKEVEHLVGGPEVHVGALGPVQGVGTPLGVDQNLTVNGVFGVNVVGVPGGHDRLIQGAAEFYHVL